MSHHFPAYYLISLCLFRYLVIIFSEAMLTEGYRSSNNNFTDMSYRLKTEFDIFSGGCEICWGIRDNWVVHTCLFYFIAACAILSKNSSSHSKCSANTSSHILKKSFDLKIYFILSRNFDQCHSYQYQSSFIPIYLINKYLIGTINSAWSWAIYFFPLLLT